MNRLVFRDTFILLVFAALPATWSFRQWEGEETKSRPYEIAIGDPIVATENVLWIDARDRQLFEEGKIPGAVLLNEDEWDALLGDAFEQWQPGRTIIVYCSAGCEESEKVATRLREIGMEPVYFLRGGYEAWKKRQTLTAGQ